MDAASCRLNQRPAHNETEQCHQCRSAVDCLDHFHPRGCDIRADDGGVTVEAHHRKVRQKPRNNHQKTGDQTGNKGFFPFGLACQGEHAHRDGIDVVGNIQNTGVNAQRNSDRAVVGAGVHRAEYMGNVAALVDEYQNCKQNIAAIQ